MTCSVNYRLHPDVACKVNVSLLLIETERCKLCASFSVVCVCVRACMCKTFTPFTLVCHFNSKNPKCRSQSGGCGVTADARALTWSRGLSISENRQDTGTILSRPQNSTHAIDLSPWAISNHYLQA